MPPGLADPDNIQEVFKELFEENALGIKEFCIHLENQFRAITLSKKDAIRIIINHSYQLQICGHEHGLLHLTMLRAIWLTFLRKIRKVRPYMCLP